MISYENIDFASSCMHPSDYVFTAEENFSHEWSLYAQRHIDGVGIVKYKKLVLVVSSLDELKVWIDIHIPGAKLLSSVTCAEYVNYVKMSTIQSCGLITRKTY